MVAPIPDTLLNWFPHSIVFLWIIVEAYVEEWRQLTGWPVWGNHFEYLATEAARHILEVATAILLYSIRIGNERAIM